MINFIKSIFRKPTIAELPQKSWREFVMTRSMSSDFEAGFIKCGEVLAKEFSDHPKCKTAYGITKNVIAHHVLKNEVHS